MIPPGAEPQFPMEGQITVLIVLVMLVLVTLVLGPVGFALGFGVATVYMTRRRSRHS